MIRRSIPKPLAMIAKKTLEFERFISLMTSQYPQFDSVRYNWQYIGSSGGCCSLFNCPSNGHYFQRGNSLLPHDHTLLFLLLFPNVPLLSPLTRCILRPGQVIRLPLTWGYAVFFSPGTPVFSTTYNPARGTPYGVQSEFTPPGAPCWPYKRMGVCGSVFGYPASKKSLGPLWI